MPSLAHVVRRATPTQPLDISPALLAQARGPTAPRPTRPRPAVASLRRADAVVLLGAAVLVGAFFVATASGRAPREAPPSRTAPAEGRAGRDEQARLPPPPDDRPPPGFAGRARPSAAPGALAGAAISGAQIAGAAREPRPQRDAP